MTRDQACVMCGERAHLWRAALGTAVFTRRGVERARARILAAEAPQATAGDQIVAGDQNTQDDRTARGDRTAWGEPVDPPRPADAPSRAAARAAAWSWMRTHGHPGALLAPTDADHATTDRTDMSADITSGSAVALVVHVGTPVSAHEVQRVHDLAEASGRRPLLFSGVGFAPPAILWAREQGVELYTVPTVVRVA